MAGNVFEWTSSVYAATNAHIFRGGSWFNHDGDCTVSYWGYDNPYFTGINIGFRVCRNIDVEPDGMVWVDINDHSYIVQMSKYETTNVQYCQFLNAALASGDITVSGNIIYGANGSNSGVDYVAQVYYNLDGVGVTTNGATNGGAARINYSGGTFSVDSGFENHPVTWVSWYGSTAFCNYYRYRLPIDGEWQNVADYDGTYFYGCGTTISNSIANYSGSTHPYGTTVVGAFGTYGYGMCDIAGNVWEWISPPEEGRHVRVGGGWASGGDNSYDNDQNCTVFSRASYPPDGAFPTVGFRVCR